jgi:hypothetical protein
MFVLRSRVSYRCRKRCSIRMRWNLKHHTLSATPLLYPCCACAPRHRLLTWSPRDNLLLSRSIAVSAVLRNLCRLRVSSTRRQPRRVSRATHHPGRFHVLRHHHLLTRPLSRERPGRKIAATPCSPLVRARAGFVIHNERGDVWIVLIHHHISHTSASLTANHAARERPTRSFSLTFERHL